MKKRVVLLIYFISHVAKAQVASELSPKSLTLPRLSTAQQNTLPPQQAGNVVYNSDEKKLAVHDGAQWNYISGISNSSSNPYKNHKLFTNTDTFIVPSGITEMLIEVWGNGADGQIMSTVGSNVPCSGGGGGQYMLALAMVNPGDVVELYFDDYANFILNDGIQLASSFHGNGRNGGSGISNSNSNIVMVVNGEHGQNADFSFQQANAGVFRKIVKGGAGGGSYPTFKNGGTSQTMEFDVNTGQFVGSSYSNGDNNGKFPGGGGGCGNSLISFGYGRRGAILIHY
jgi:hypothetical protein